MLEDINAISYYIDPFIHKYLVIVFIMCTDDVRHHLFIYNFGIF